MSIVIKKPWTRQPQTPVGIDYSNPLGRRVISVIVGTDNYIRGINQLATIAGTPTQGVNADGRVLVADTNGAFLRKDNLTAREKPTEITVFWRGSVTTSAVTNNPILCGIPYNTVDGSPYLCAAINRTNTATTSVLFGWNQAGTYRAVTVGSAFVTDEIATFVLTVKSGVASFYKNGVKIATDSANASTINYSSTSFFTVGGHSSLSITPYSKTSIAGYLNGALSEAEVVELSKNPWQLLAPQRRMLFAPVAAVGGGFQAAWAIRKTRTIGAGVI